jgi:DNA-binding NtrC family response regulator
MRGYNRCPVLLMADEITIEQALEALRVGVADVLIKPFDLSGLTSICSARLRVAAAGEEIATR